MKLGLEAICLLLCFTAVAQSTEEATLLDPRGNRPVAPGTAAQKSGDCQQGQDWPPCSDSIWGKNCPSGCRVQGLMGHVDQQLQDRIDNLRKLLEANQNSYKTASQVTKETYDLIKENLNSNTGIDNRYAELVTELRKRIVLLKQYINNQLIKIRQLHTALVEQVNQMKRLEVDIDIHIRACKGSCSKGFVYSVDKQTYETLQKQLVQIGSHNLRTADDVDSVRVLKMRQPKDQPSQSLFKAAQTADGEQLPVFSGIPDTVFILERQTKETSRVSSTDFVVKESLTSGSTGGISPSTVKETTGTGGTVTSTQTSTRVLKCTRTITKKIVHTKDGPVETVEVTGGDDSPDCAHLEKLGMGEPDMAGGGSYTVKMTGTSGLGGLSDSYPDLSQFVNRQPSVTKETVGGGSSSVVKKEVWSSGGSGGSTTTKFGTQLGGGAGSGGTTTRFSDSRAGGSDTMNLHTSEFDDFESFPSFVPGESAASGSTSYTKTTISSSSSTKDGPFSERKTMKSGPVFYDDGAFIQQDQSGEDFPNPQARSLKKEVKTMEGYVGQDCDDIHQKHASGSKSGLFQIKPSGSEKVVTVYCDQETGLGGWALIQQRMDGSLNFNRTWNQYKKGFGSVNDQGIGELWLGNELIHLLTKSDSVLRIELEDWAGNQAYAEYNVNVGSESQGYILKVSNYEGSAGDALIKGSLEDGQNTQHAGMKFSTYDRDSDMWEENCAEMYGGGWWYNNCQAANLNGIYYQGGQYDPRNNVPYEMENGVVWIPFKSADYSLRVVRMKIRPVETH